MAESETAGPVRSFFDKRYTFPGYTFLLVVTLALANRVVGFVGNSGGQTATLILGVVLLLDGAPLGFLISQPWFVILNHYVKPNSLWVNNIKSADSSLKEDTSMALVAGDLLVFSEQKQTEMKEYLRRRIDLVNLMGSIMLAIPFATVASFVLDRLWKSTPPNPSFNHAVYLMYFLLVLLEATIYLAYRSTRREWDLASWAMMREAIDKDTPAFKSLVQRLAEDARKQTEPNKLAQPTKS